MAGKILGIGSLSLTQVVLWGVMAMAGIGFTMHLPNSDMVSPLHFGSGTVVMFAIFYALGYLLYSSLYAGVGAAFNSADEGQYWSFILTLPLLLAGITVWSLFEQANSALAVFLSLLPPLTPVIMSMRLAVGPVPSWQVVLALASMMAAIYAAWALSARIYRVGTLMYGKKPSFREITHWLRYA